MHKCFLDFCSVALPISVALIAFFFATSQLPDVLDSGNISMLGSSGLLTVIIWLIDGKVFNLYSTTAV